MGLRIFGYVCLTIISGAILSAAGVLAWFIADRKVPVELVRSEVLTPSVSPGGKLVIRQTLRYLRDCKAHIDRALYDDHTHRVFLPDIDYERPPQGLGEFTVTFEIDVPDWFEAGDGEYRAAPLYACNPVQRHYWPITRDETVIRFKIVYE